MALNKYDLITTVSNIHSVIFPIITTSNLLSLLTRNVDLQCFI